jgi:hypothetical protein
MFFDTFHLTRTRNATVSLLLISPRNSIPDLQYVREISQRGLVELDNYLELISRGAYQVHSYVVHIRPPFLRLHY